MICPKCKKEIPAGSNICPACYADLTRYRLNSEANTQDMHREGSPSKGGAPLRGAGTYGGQGARRRPGGQANPQALVVAAGLVIVFLVLLILLFRAIFSGGDPGTPNVSGLLEPSAAPSPTYKIFGVDTNTPEPTAEPDPLANLQIIVTPDPTATPEPVYETLKKGSKGDDVKRLQEALIALGYLDDGGADGDYGNATVAAVKEFQKDNGLSADGQAGQQTLTMLYRKYGGDIDTQSGTSNNGSTSGDSGTTDDGLILNQPG